jgi:hypothetical protein
VRALEQSWPHDTIIGDRESGILVQSNRIVHVDLDNSFSIAGPLNAPEPATGASVIAWYAGTEADAPPIGEADNPIDLVLGAHGSVPIVALGDGPPADGVTGVVLRAAPDQSVGNLLDVAEGWLRDGFRPLALGGSLRAALALSAPAPLPAAARPAFPVPQPHASL